MKAILTDNEDCWKTLENASRANHYCSRIIVRIKNEVKGQTEKKIYC